MSDKDLAAGALVGSFEPTQIWAGEAPIVTDAAPALEDNILKYEVLTLTTTGVRRFDAGDVGAECVIAAQAAGIGAQVPYFAAGKFNHEALVWPAGADFDTYEERRQFFMGTGIHIGRLANVDGPGYPAESSPSASASPS